MNSSAANHLMLFLIGVIFVKSASLSVMKTVKRGTTVSLLCSNILREPSYVAWFKHTSDSLPLCIATQYVGEQPADSIYFNGFQKNHLEMSVNQTFSSLKIVNADIFDSGVFYCGSFLSNRMMFHNKTQLVVVNETNHLEEDIAIMVWATEENLRSCHIYYTMALILSGFVLLAILFVIVVSFKLKKRNKQKGMSTHLYTQ
ncbi:uncharacterized protein LOC122348527 [Puntigrus tetrazona]|uniref:uncharacterized protein LOC122348527 n=1 Tax=Puntigrus tetrazona TaxID=1606681 RepID=UPI001C89DE4F|nr:uncharacterized protein LOC122348527 [Puntigrus tetrazona]